MTLAVESISRAPLADKAMALMWLANIKTAIET